MVREKNNLYIGTSGFSYHHWKGKFYPQNLPSREYLRFYASRFNSVELNVTFYRQPREKTVREWFESVPEGFSFVVKAPRVITHIKRLKDSVKDAASFLETMEPLGNRLSCVLWQFPPGFNPDPLQLEEFFSEVRKQAPEIRHAVELRNSLSFNEEVYEALRRCNACLVCAHSSRYPCVLERTADFSYFRFHGPGSLYNSRYSEEDLDIWIEKIAMLLEAGDVYVFFNNDFGGFAIENADYVLKRLKGE